LEPHERLAERGGEHLREFGLPHARLALEKEGTRHCETKKDRRRKLPVGDVVVPVEQRDDVVDGCGERCRQRVYPAAVTARAARTEIRCAR